MKQKLPGSDLNTAYRRGNLIKQKTQALPSGSLLPLEFGHVPVIVGQATPGAGSIQPPTREQALLDASIIASGFSNTPAFTTIGPGVITLEGSGVGANMILWAGKTPFGGKFSAIVSDGDFVVSGGNSLTLNQSDPGGSMLLESRGNITLAPHGASGLVRYELGPNEGLHIRPSTSNDFILIPNEEQVRAIVAEMISGVC